MKGIQPSIRTVPRPDCYACGSPGAMCYQGLPDHLFGTHGQWSFRQCTDPACKMLWLDPAPVEEDIGLLYRAYYTHPETEHTGTSSIAAPSLRRLLRRSVDWSLVLTPVGRERKRIFMMYLDRDVPGRLLDVGCGDGRRLAEMAELGWHGIGQEIDIQAAEFAAKTYGVNVIVGDLTSLDTQDEGFNAITVSHVIEHVVDPIDLLRQCHRLLMPGGKLVVTTPNVCSIGHRAFGAAWMGLDPPRHLHVFSPNALAMVTQQVEFERFEVTTKAANAQWFAIGSFAIQQNKPYGLGHYPSGKTHLAALAFQMRAWMNAIADPDSGDECLLIAIK